MDCCLPVGTSAGRRPDKRVGAIYSKVLIIGEGEIEVYTRWPSSLIGLVPYKATLEHQTL